MTSIQEWHISQQRNHFLYGRSFLKHVLYTMQELMSCLYKRSVMSGDHLSVCLQTPQFVCTVRPMVFTQVNHALYLSHTPRQNRSTNSNIVTVNEDKSERLAGNWIWCYVLHPRALSEAKCYPNMHFFTVCNWNPRAAVDGILFTIYELVVREEHHSVSVSRNTFPLQR